MHHDNWRFRGTLSKLRECDDVIEHLIAQDDHVPLSATELRACHELLELCGIILSRVFNSRPDAGRELGGFVFGGGKAIAEQVIEVGNRQLL